MNKQMSAIMLVLATLAAVMFQNCSKAAFTNADSSDNNSDLGDGVVICDPFLNGADSCDRNITGEIYYLTSAQRTSFGATGLDTYFDHGTKLDVSISLPRLFIPTMLFSTGFPINGSSTDFILDENGNKLDEYFAMKLRTDLALVAGDPTGTYQIAVLSDDGGRVSNRKSNQVLIQNDGSHPTRLGCAAQVLNLQKGKKLPLLIEYYQGPRHHIALTLLWRKVANGTNPSESLCGVEGNDEYFGSSYNDFSNAHSFGKLIDRGWEPIPAANLNSVSNKD